MSLMNKFLTGNKNPNIAKMSESNFFDDKDFVKTDLPILNLAFSGSLDGGLSTGITILAGESATFKTLLGLYCMKAYLDKYEDSIAILYDSEFSITPEYLKMYDIDPNRILHVLVDNVEQLKFDMVDQFGKMSRGDKVFILLDSLGATPSKKEIDDAKDAKSVADMSRAKSIRSLLRNITGSVNKLDIPLVIINHIYQTQELYSKIVIPGGTAVTYASNSVIVTTKAQEKNADGSLGGWKFTMTPHKSRFVKNKAKFPFTVSYKTGIDRYSGIFDLAVEAKLIVQSGAWYQLVDLETGEIQGNKVRSKDIGNDFFELLLKSTLFKKFCEDKFKLGDLGIGGSELDDDITNLLNEEVEEQDDE